MSWIQEAGTVGVFLGGKSREREISLRSGEAVYKALISSGVSAVKIDPQDHLEAQLAARPIDLAFIALHGQGGEDGEIQRFFESRSIFYVGSDSKSSLVAFDKVKSKTIFEAAQIPTPRYSVLNQEGWKEVLKTWTVPYVLKPSQEGSSIGVFFVQDQKEGIKKAEELLQNYETLLVEEQIKGGEYTVGILGGRALPVIQLKPKRDFYDYTAKYTKGLTEYLVPAPISEAESRILQDLALKTHHALGMRDFSRIDILVSQAKQPYVLEANSIPGFTETSLLPKAAQAVGLSFEMLCLELLSMAFHRKAKSGQTSITSNPALSF